MRNLFILIWVIVILLAGCQSSTQEDNFTDPFEVIGAEKEKIIGDYSESFFEPIDKDTATMYSNSIFDRLHNIPTGKYLIQAYNSGVIYLYDEKRNLIFKEFFEGNIVVLDITKDYVIEFKGPDSLYLVEYNEEMLDIPPDIFPKDIDLENIEDIDEYVEELKSELLLTGVWHVGNDIEPGDYTITGTGHGYLQILDPAEEHKVYEILGNDYVSSSSTISLSEGQKLRINGVPAIRFEKQ